MKNVTTAMRAGIVSLTTLGLAGTLAGCGGAASPGPASTSVTEAGRTAYTCQGGHLFDVRYNESARQMVMRLDGATSHPHELDQIVDPSGRTLFQDAEYQFRPGASPAAVTLTDRSNSNIMTCTQIP